jgi:hypothetical protein
MFCAPALALIVPPCKNALHDNVIGEGAEENAEDRVGRGKVVVAGF